MRRQEMERACGDEECDQGRSHAARAQGVMGRRGQQVGVRQVTDRIWLVRFMNYDLGYFDDET